MKINHNCSISTATYTNIQLQIVTLVDAPIDMHEFICSMVNKNASGIVKTIRNKHYTTTKLGSKKKT